MSRSLLTQGSRHLPPCLILVVRQKMKMQYPVAVCCALFVTGCASSRKSGPDSLSDYHRRLVEVASFAVPLPKVTPYDANPEERAAYLDSFGQGYRSGLIGWRVSHCLTDVAHREARIKGWYAGQNAGWDLWAEKHLAIK